MAFSGLINSYSRNHRHSGICRHFGKRSVSIWRNVLRDRPTLGPTSLCESRTHSSASCVILSKHFSICNKQSLSCPCQGHRIRIFNVNKFGLHCSSRSLLQKESVTQRSDEQDNHTTLQDRGDTIKESSVNEDVTKQHCQNTEEKTKVDTNESLTNNLIICSVGRPSLNDTRTSFRKTSSKDDSSSQTSVPITTGWLEQE